jgi:hypothetical protein
MGRSPNNVAHATTFVAEEGWVESSEAELVEVATGEVVDVGSG